jgi:hypothetical protein
VRRAFISLETRILYQLGGKHRGSSDRDDLIVIAVDDHGGRGRCTDSRATRSTSPPPSRNKPLVLELARSQSTGGGNIFAGLSAAGIGNGAENGARICPASPEGATTRTAKRCRIYIPPINSAASNSGVNWPLTNGLRNLCCPRERRRIPFCRRPEYAVF